MTNDSRASLRSFWTPNYWPTWILLGLLRLICLLPQRARLSIGFSIGRLGHRFAGERRAITRRNIELCFPDLTPNERDAMAKAHFEALGASAIEMGLGRWASDEELQRLSRVEGVEHINNAVKEGHGVIMLSAHFTPLEISGRVISMQMPPFDCVYRKHKNKFITAILQGNRERSARKSIEKNDIRSMVKTLREGLAVWYAPDQSFKGKNAALVPFFGIPAMSTVATGTLAKLGKAVVIPFFPKRFPDGTYVTTILPPIEGIPSGDPIADTEKYNEVLEAQILQCPEQYYWIHKKFKDRPPPLPDLYSDLDSLK